MDDPDRALTVLDREPAQRVATLQRSKDAYTGRRIARWSWIAAAGTRAGQLRRHLSDPFFRSAYALVLNTGLTGVLGILFWALAARQYDDPDVGRNSAAISAMLLISGIVAANVNGTLNRFLPHASSPARFVLYTYAISSVIVALLTATFFFTSPWWGPSFDLLRDPEIAFYFAAAVIASTLFTIQDGVLVGLRGSIWVPTENTAFGIIKIVLLVLLAPTFPQSGVYLSWVLATAIMVLPVNLLIFGRLTSRRSSSKKEPVERSAPQGVGKFLAADFIGSLFTFASIYLIPVVVAAYVSAFTFAYFYFVWIMSGVLNLVAVNLGMSLAVEGVYDEGRLAANCRAALQRAVGFYLVAGVAISVVAPYGLTIIGPGYTDAAPLLQLLALAAVPRAIVEIWLGVLRAQGNRRQIAGLQICRGVLVLGTAFLMLQAQWGIRPITGVGIAVLVSQLAVAAVVVPALRRFLAHHSSPPTAGHVSAGYAPFRVDDSARTDLSPRRSARGVALSRLFAKPRATGLVGPQRLLLPVTIAALVLGGASLFVLSLPAIDLGAMNGYGLASVLPVATVAGPVILMLAFVVTLATPYPRPILLGTQIVLTMFCLHGITGLVEPLPRFQVTWAHIGFVEYISRTGTTLPGIDGRFSWPGFFSLAALALGGAEWQVMVPLLKFVPLLSNLLYLLPLALLLRNLNGHWRAKWFAAWLFAVMNWVGQDYFSPQGFSYWAYLVFVALLVTWFRSERAHPRGLLSTFARRLTRGRFFPAATVPGEMPPRRIADPTTRPVVLLLLLGLFTVVTASHQLTPFFMLAACAALVIVRCCLSKGLPVLLAVILVGYVSFLAAAYWSGHLAELVAGVGNLGRNISNSVVDRSTAGDIGHQTVVYTRIGLAVAVVLLAVLGLVRRLRAGIDDRVATVLLATPFLALGLQSYGGEMALRVYLFCLPAACILAAYAIFPETSPSSSFNWRKAAACCACAVVLLAAFPIARYGNEKFEMMRAGDLQAAQYIYEQGGRTRIVFLATDPDRANPFMPLLYRDVDRVSYVSLQAPQDPTDMRAVLEELRQLGPGAFLMTTHSQESYLELSAGYREDWGTQLRERLAAEPAVETVVDNDDSAVFRMRDAAEAGSSRARDVDEIGPGTHVGDTPLTNLGLTFLSALLVLLPYRELRRLAPGPSNASQVRQLTLVAVPLIVGFIVVVIERVVVMT